MVRDLHGRRLLITGASGGIGRAVAEQAARAGARLTLAARSADKLDVLARELSAHAEVIAVPTDVTSPDDRRRLFAAAVERFDGLDVLINNAGVGSFGHFAECTEAILRQIMEVNFFAPAELIRLAIPILAQGRQPAVVNVASMCGRRGVPAWSEYSRQQVRPVRPDRGAARRDGPLRHRRVADRARPDPQRTRRDTCSATKAG